ncbi:SDR family NAD(P)-dependent oxidoreductase [Microbispora sp. NPDC004025]
MTRRTGTTRFTGKVAVVTGAGSGIGRALALRLAGSGAALAISDIDAAGLAETADRCKAGGADVKADHLDVTDRDAVASYAGDVLTQFGRVNQLYNNAGIAYYGEVERARLEDVEHIFKVNFWGAVYATTAFLPHLVASGDGHLVTVSSLFGLITFPGQSAYNASKFAVRGFTEALRQEMLAARHPVHVTCVHPGGIRTGITRRLAVADGLDGDAIAGVFDRRLALHSPEMAAAVILDGVRRRRARVVIGAEAKALDWLARITPSGSQRTGVLMARLLGLSPSPRSAL